MIIFKKRGHQIYKNLIVMLILSSICLLTACGSNAVKETEAEETAVVSSESETTAAETENSTNGDVSSQKFTIVHTNDVHSYVDIEPYVKSYVADLREQGEEVILLSAGDAFAGTTFALLSNGIDVATVMNETGYELFTLGNHETLMKDEYLKEAMAAVEFPIITANPEDFGDKLTQAVPQLKPYVIRELAGEKVAFIGLSAILDTTLHEHTGDHLVEVMETAHDAAEKEGATIFIGVTHTGMTDPDETNRSTYIAEHCQWLTAIIDAHCHTVLENGLQVGDVLIAETGEYGNHIGVVELTITDSVVTNKTARLIPIAGNEDLCGITPDADLAAFIDNTRKENETYLNTVVAQVPAELVGEREKVRSIETNLGDIFCDAMLWATDSDVSTAYAYFLRTNLPEGPLTNEMLMNVFLEWQAPIYIYDQVSGSEIRQILEYSMKAAPEMNANMMQVGGLSFTYDPNEAEGSKTKEVTMSDGTALEADKTYKYVSMQWLPVFLETEEEKRSFSFGEKTVQEVFVDYLNSDEELCVKPEGRFVPIK